MWDHRHENLENHRWSLRLMCKLQCIDASKASLQRVGMYSFEDTMSFLAGFLNFSI